MMEWDLVSVVKWGWLELEYWANLGGNDGDVEICDAQKVSTKIANDGLVQGLIMSVWQRWLFCWFMVHYYIELDW